MAKIVAQPKKGGSLAKAAAKTQRAAIINQRSMASANGG